MFRHLLTSVFHFAPLPRFKYASYLWFILNYNWHSASTFMSCLRSRATASYEFCSFIVITYHNYKLSYSKWRITYLTILLLYNQFGELSEGCNTNFRVSNYISLLVKSHCLYYRSHVQSLIMWIHCKVLVFSFVSVSDGEIKIVGLSVALSIRIAFNNLWNYTKRTCRRRMQSLSSTQ